jgi:hypothetical protein
VSLKARSGGATSYLAADPNTYPTETYLVERGTGPRLPWTYGADLQFSYRVGMMSGMALSLTADIFNVLNFQEVIRQNEQYTAQNVVAVKGAKIADLKTTYKDADGMPLTQDPGFGSPNKYQAPRVFRFGVRGEF